MKKILHKNIAQKAVCGIIGGMGPSAGVSLHQKIIKYTPNVKIDQSHLTIHHISQPSFITDRTRYLLSETTKKIENPALGAYKSYQSLINSVNKQDKVIIGIPCNTFHSSYIWIPFLQKININSRKNTYILNMIQETVDNISVSYPSCKKIGILCTNGTKDTYLYDNYFDKQQNKEIIYLDGKWQTQLSSAIYNLEWGLKVKNNPIDNKVTDILHNCVKYLIEKHVDVIILGCSELPLALPATESYQNTGIPLIDPVEVLAKKMINKVLE